MDETIYGFLPSQFEDPALFRIELAGITYPSASYHITRRPSSVFDIEYVQAGRGTLVINQQRVNVKAGDTYLLMAGDDHDYWSDPKAPLQKIWVNAAGSVIQQLCDQYQLGSQIVFSGLNTQAILDRILAFCHKTYLDPQARTMQGTVLVHELLLTLHHEQQQHLPNLHAPLAEQMRIYLDNHLESPVAITTLAAAINLSSAQLTRQFKTAFGLPPYQYLLNRRIAMAKILLTHTNLTSAQIANRLAFSDPHYFSNVFLTKVGQRPSQWRKQGR